MPSRTPTHRSGTIQSLRRGLQVLQAIADAGGRASLTDIAHKLGLNFSTTHHLAKTLEEDGYLVQDEDSQPCGVVVGPCEVGGLPADRHATRFKDGPQDLGRFAQTVNDNDFRSFRHEPILVGGATAIGGEQNVAPAGVCAGQRRGGKIADRSASAKTNLGLPEAVSSRWRTPFSSHATAAT